jgi:hypothetical protein
MPSPIFAVGMALTSTQDLFKRARANPMPLAFVGVGIAWLMATNVSGQGLHRSRGSSAPGKAGGSIGHPNAAEQNIKQEIQTMAHSARDTLTSLASNPFALGAVAAVVGAVAGALIPTFEQEEAALGTAATKIREKGRDLAQGVIDMGSRVASETLDAAAESAGAHGLTGEKPVGDVVADLKSGNLISDVKTVAQETLEAGQESARQQFAPGDSKEASPAGA